MSETPEPNIPQATPEPVPQKRIGIKELLEKAKYEPISYLKSKEITLELKDNTIVVLNIKQLSKLEYDLLHKQIKKSMPDVPFIEQNYTSARKNPVTGEIKPAGVYKEANPSDPHYLQESQEWFNESCIWMAIYSCSADFGYKLSTMSESDREDQLGAKFDQLAEMFTTPTLLNLAVEVAQLNRGINLAEQLLSAVSQQHDYESAQELLAEVQAEMAKKNQ